MKEGYKKTAIGYIPLEWRLMQIGEVMEFSGGAQPPKEYFINEPREGYIRLIQIRDYKTSEYITYIPIDKARKICTKNDIMIGRYGPPIFQILKGLEGAYNVALIKAMPDENMLNKEYARIFLKTEKLFKLIDRLSQRTSGQTGIDMDALNNYLIPIPSLKEQQKIVDIILTVDSQIDDTDKIIEKAKDLKKGLMQRLLTKGIGHKEFKKSEVGEIPVEWEVTTLNECGQVFGGNAFKSTKFVTEKNDRCYQVIRMGNVQQCKLALDRNPVYLEENNLDEKGNKYILRQSDVLISLTGTVNKTDYGNVAWVDLENRYLLNQRVACFRKNSNLYLNRYIYYLMQSKMFRNQFFELGVGGTGNQANVSIGDLSNIKIYKIPIEEQNIIANILLSVDIEIEEYKNKKLKLEELKKGLMQQLLIGKIRSI